MYKKIFQYIHDYHISQFKNVTLAYHVSALPF